MFDPDQSMGLLNGQGEMAHIGLVEAVEEEAIS